MNPTTTVSTYSSNNQISGQIKKNALEKSNSSDRTDRFDNFKPNSVENSSLITHIGIPPLEECLGDFEPILEVLNRKYHFIGYNDFKATFSMAELLTFLIDKFADQIETIELVGGAVNTVLSHSYLCRAFKANGLQRITNYLNDAFIKANIGTANDIDFRITLKKGANQAYLLKSQFDHDLHEEIRRSVCTFLAKNCTSNPHASYKEITAPSLNDCRYAWENGFTKKSRNLKEGINIYGMQTAQTRIEIVIFEQEPVKRKFLFNSDDLRFPLKPLLVDQDQSIGNLELQSERGALSALYAKIHKEVDLYDIESMNIYGFPLWLTKLVNGYTCPSSDNQDKLLARYLLQLKQEDLPKGYSASKNLTDEFANIPSLISFHHTYCLENHLKNTPEQAFALAFLLCTFLEEKLPAYVLKEIWANLEENIKKLQNKTKNDHPHYNNLLPIKYLNCLSKQYFSFKQLYEWLSFTSLIHAISDHHGNVECGKISKVEHSLTTYLQANFNDAYLLFPIASIPSTNTIALMQRYLFGNGSLFLIDWNRAIELDQNYQEQLENFIPVLTGPDKDLLDPLLSFEMYALIQHSNLADVRNELLSLFPKVLIKNESVAAQAIKWAFRADECQAEVFHRILSSLASIDRNHQQIEETALHSSLKLFACSSNAFLRAYASGEILKMNPKEVSVQIFYKEIYPDLEKHNLCLALSVLPKINYSTLEKYKIYNTLCEQSLNENQDILIDKFCDFLMTITSFDSKFEKEGIKAINFLLQFGRPLSRKLIDILNAHLRLVKIPSQRHRKTQSENTFPQLQSFLNILITNGFYSDVKMLMLISKQKNLCEVNSLWLRCCKSLSMNNPEDAYLLLKEGQVHGLVSKKDPVTDLLISFLGRVSAQTHETLINEIVSAPLTELQEESIKSHLQELVSNRDISQLLIQQNQLSQKSLQELRLSYLNRLTENEGIAPNYDIAANVIKDLIRCNIPVKPSIIENIIDRYLINITPVSAIHFLLQDELKIIFQKDNKIIFRYIIQKLECLLAAKEFVNPSLLETTVEYICLSNFSEALSVPFQKRALILTFELFNQIWSPNIKVSSSLTSRITTHLTTIIGLIREDSIKFMNFLNAYNIKVSINNPKDKELIYDSFKGLLSNGIDLHSIHILIKNTFESGRLNINDKEFISLKEILIKTLMKTKNESFALYWIDKVLSSLKVDFIVKIVRQLIERNNTSSAIKYLKHLDQKHPDDLDKFHDLFSNYFLAFLRQSVEPETIITFLIKNSTFFLERIDKKLIDEEIIIFLKKSSCPCDRKLELFQKFKINEDQILERIVLQIPFSKQLLEENFKRFLDILHTMPKENLSIPAMRASLYFIIHLKQVNSVQGKKFLLNSDLLCKVFSERYLLETHEQLYNDIFEHYIHFFINSTSINDHSRQAFIQLKAYYEKLSFSSYIPAFLQIFKSIDILLLADNPTPDSILTLCTLITEMISSKNEIFTLYSHIFSNRLGECFIQTTNQIRKTYQKFQNTNEQQYFQQQMELHSKVFKPQQIRQTVLTLLDWWLKREDIHEEIIPLSFLKACKDEFPADIILKGMELFFKCKNCYNWKATNQEFTLKMDSLGYELFLEYTQSKSDSVSQTAFKYIEEAIKAPRDSSPVINFLTPIELCKIVENYLSFELNLPFTSYESIEDKLNLFNKFFKYTSKVTFELPDITSTIHLKLIEPVIKLLSNELLNDLNIVYFEDQFKVISQTVYEKILYDDPASTIKDPLMEWHTHIACYLSAAFNEPRQVPVVLYMLKRCLKINFEAFLENAYPEKYFLESLFSLCFHNKISNTDMDRFYEILSVCTSHLQAVPNPSEAVKSTLFQYQELLTHCSQLYDPHKNLPAAKSNVDIKDDLKQYLISSLFNALISKTTPTAIVLALKLTFDDSYLKSEPKIHLYCCAVIASKTSEIVGDLEEGPTKAMIRSYALKIQNMTKRTIESRFNHHK